MKWMQQYEGLRMLAPVVAEIQQSSRTKPKKVHIDKLKKFEGEEPAIWPAAANRLAGRQDMPSSNERSNEETEEAVWATKKSILEVRSPPMGRRPHFPC